jgi:uncharacterized protein
MTPRAIICAAALLWATSALARPLPGEEVQPAVDPAYQHSFQAWKSALVENRKENWLTLSGLFWLKPGENSFGTDAGSAIVFPKGPAHAGVFELQGTEVTVKLAPGVSAAVAGKAVTVARLLPDTSENPTVVEMGSLRLKVIVRGRRIGIRLKDLKNDAANHYRDPTFYPLNPAYRVVAEWIPAQGKQTVDVPNVLGDIDPTPVAGTAVFKIQGHEGRLTDLGGDPSKGLFFVFNDLTTRSETYPGGRFLDAGPVENGTVVLDFNQAYNPPCSVTPYATCPLAPRENRLAVAITAGEKYDRAYGHP